MRTKTVMVLLVLAGAAGVGGAWLMMQQQQRSAAALGAAAAPAAEASTTAAAVPGAPGTPAVPLQPWQQALLQQARAGQAPSMRKLAQSLVGDPVSHIDAPTALYWAQQAQAAGDPVAAGVVAEIDAYLRKAKPPERSAPAPTGPRQAHAWLLGYAAAYEACMGDKRATCLDQNRKILAENVQVQPAWQQVLAWPAAAAADEQLEARRAAAYLLAFGLQPFGLPLQQTPWRGADDPLKGRALLEELATAGDLQDQLMLALSLSESPAPADVERAAALVAEIGSSDDAKKLSEFRYSLLDQPPQRGWTRRAHDRLFPGLADPTAHYLRRAADAGAFNEAQTLGLAYFFGGSYFAGLSIEQWDIAGIKQDHASAMKYLERAEASGRREAGAVLGALLLAGNGVTQDYRRGLRLLRDSARNGSLWALGSLAQIYARGNFGVEKSPTAGYAMANIAMRLGATKAGHDQFAASLDEGGIEMARAVLNELQDQLPPPQLARAQEISRDWMPGTVLPTSASGRGLLHGTGVYISPHGEMLTNAHVVKGCTTVRLAEGGEEGAVARVDTANDLALIRFKRAAASYVPVRTDPPNLGEPITVFGFPLVGPLSAAGNVTNGIVSSESGYEDNSLQFQFTAPVQSGSSGGPVLDSKARLVGVIIGKLNAELTARTTGETPQNANFGIKNVAVAAFLRGASVDYARPAFYDGLLSRSPEDLAQEARAASRRIECAP